MDDSTFFEQSRDMTFKNAEDASEKASGADSGDLRECSFVGDGDFENLARHFEKALRVIAASFGGIPEAERDDLYQEGLIALYRAFCTYKPEMAKFSTYAEVCIKRAMVSYLRAYSARNKGVVSLSPDEPTLGGEATDGVFSCFDGRECENPEALYLSKESLQSMKRYALDRLSDYERCVFLLYLEGYESGEIASTLGKAQRSVDNALLRIRRKLSGRV